MRYKVCKNEIVSHNYEIKIKYEIQSHNYENKNYKL